MEYEHIEDVEAQNTLGDESRHNNEHSKTRTAAQYTKDLIQWLREPVTFRGESKPRARWTEVLIYVFVAVILEAVLTCIIAIVLSLVGFSWSYPTLSKHWDEDHKQIEDIAKEIGHLVKSVDLVQQHLANH